MGWCFSVFFGMVFGLFWDGFLVFFGRIFLQKSIILDVISLIVDNTYVWNIGGLGVYLYSRFGGLGVYRRDIPSKKYYLRLFSLIVDNTHFWNIGELGVYLYSMFVIFFCRQLFLTTQLKKKWDGVLVVF